MYTLPCMKQITGGKLLRDTASSARCSVMTEGGRGFPDSSVGKESACTAGDPGSIPGSGRFAGEGIGYPLQYSWASLVAQLVKNPPADGGAWWAAVYGVA